MAVTRPWDPSQIAGLWAHNLVKTICILIISLMMQSSHKFVHVSQFSCYTKLWPDPITICQAHAT